MELIEEWPIAILLLLVGVFFIVVIISLVRDYKNESKGTEKNPKTKKGKMEIRKTELDEEIEKLERIKNSLDNEIKQCLYQAEMESTNLHDTIEAQRVHDSNDIQRLKDGVQNEIQKSVAYFNRRANLNICSVDIVYSAVNPTPMIILKFTME